MMALRHPAHARARGRGTRWDARYAGEKEGDPVSTRVFMGVYGLYGCYGVEVDAYLTMGHFRGLRLALGGRSERPARSAWADAASSVRARPSATPSTLTARGSCGVRRSGRGISRSQQPANPMTAPPGSPSAGDPPPPPPRARNRHARTSTSWQQPRRLLSHRGCPHPASTDLGQPSGQQGENMNTGDSIANETVFPAGAVFRRFALQGEPASLR